MFQKLHAVHNFSIPTGGQQPSGGTLSPTSNQIKIVAGQVAQASGGTASTSASSVSGGEAGAGANATVLQSSSFPQGSILVVPHPTSPFHAVLPVFANTAVIMPPGSQQQVVSSSSSATSSAPTSSSASSAGSIQVRAQ